MSTHRRNPRRRRQHGYQPGTARAALSYRRFRIIFFGLALSNIGTWMQNFTLPAYIDDRTGRPALVGLMVFMQLGPLLLLSIPGGVLADRVSKQKLQLTMQSASVDASPSSIAYCVARDAALWTLFAAQLGIGIANALNAPAFQSSMPLLVHRQDLPGAISLNSAMMNGTRVIGPILAALLAVAGLSVVRHLHRQRRYVPVLHRRPAVRADARRQAAATPPRAGAAAASGLHTVRDRTRAQPAAARHVPRSRCSASSTSACSRRWPASNFGIDAVEHHLPLAVRHLGHRRVLRRDLGRHGPRPRSTARC